VVSVRAMSKAAAPPAGAIGIQSMPAGLGGAGAGAARAHARFQRGATLAGIRLVERDSTSIPRQGSDHAFQFEMTVGDMEREHAIVCQPIKIQGERFPRQQVGGDRVRG
jgi:hypothetical protein